MSKVIKFPNKPNKQDAYTKQMADAIDALVLSATEHISWPMIAVIMADRLGEVLRSTPAEFNGKELRKLCFKILTDRCRR